MSKVEITQDNVRLLLPSHLGWISARLAEHRNISVVEAIKAVYNTPTYKELEIERTKKWCWSPVDLMGEMSGVDTI